MKKLSIVLICVFTLFLAGFLTACGKSVEVKFNEKEYLISIGESLNLDDCISIKNGDKKDITYRFSDSQLFEASENSKTITAKKSGRGTVYAYKGANNLGYTQVVVRSKFSTPKNFNVDEHGILTTDTDTLTWNAVSGNFEGETVVAEQYKVEGKLNDSENISQTPSAPAFKFDKEGKYELKISALSTSYFSDSDAAEVVVYYNYTKPATDMIWQNGLLSWKGEENVVYSVRVDGTGVETEENAEKFAAISSKDLTEKFKSLPAGEHIVTVVARDVSGTKRDMSSEELKITKLQTPKTFAVTDGVVEVAGDDSAAALYKILVDDKEQLDYDENGKNLAGLTAGEHSIQAYAVGGDGLYFESDKTAKIGVYKLGKLDVTYVGAVANGNTIKVDIAGTSPVETKFVADGLSENILDGFSAGQQNKQGVELTIPEVGEFAVSLYQKAVAEKFGELFVLNGDASEQTKVTKLGSVNSFNHIYQEKKSVISFEKVAYAKKYQIQSSSQEVLKEYTPAGDENLISITLDARIEDLVEDGKIYVVAVGENEMTCINSSLEKQFTLLGEVEVNERENTEQSISWNAVDNAAQYEIKVEKFEDEESCSGTQAGEEVFEGLLDDTSYNFDEEGYYRVSIKAIPEDVGQYLGSKTKIVTVIVALQTTIDVVELRFDPEIKDNVRSGYYLVLQANDKVTGFEVESSSFTIQENDAVYYLGKVSVNFNNISIKTKTIDEKIYLPCEYNLVVQKLPAVSSFTIDDSTNILSVDKNTNADKVVISSNAPVGRTENGSYPLPEVNNQFSLDMQQVGSYEEISENAKTVYKYKIEENTAYIDSDIKTFNFKRLSQPTDLQYNSKDQTLTFDCDEISQRSYWILDVFGKIGSQTEKLSVRFDNSVIAKYDDATSTLTGSFVSEQAKTITIKLGEVLALIKDSQKVNAKIADFYTNATELSFAVYGYKALGSVSDGLITISSNYASLKSDASKNKLTIPKMVAQKLRFVRDELKLTWQAMSEDVSTAADAEYEVYCEGVWDKPQTTTATFLNLSEVDAFSFEEGKEYTFYIVATHANYLESADSNRVKVKKLNKIAFVTLSDGTLTFLNNNDSDSVQKVEAVIESEEPIDVTSGSVTITKAGSYKLKVVAVTEGENDYYYLDSSESVWTLKKLETLVQESLNIELNGNELSWKKFPIVESLTDNLEYLLTFSDGVNTYVCKNFKTSEVAGDKVVVDISADENILAELSKLNAGEITIGVYAHLKAYSVATGGESAGGEVYYSENISSVGYNYYAYSQEEPAKMSKYDRPVLGTLEFVYENRSEQEKYLQDANAPQIKITFKGEYGEGNFRVVVGNQAVEDLEVTHSSKPEDLDEYTFTLKRENYENAAMFDSFKILIYALNNEGDSLYLPSSACEIVVVKAQMFTDIQFANDADGNLLDTLKLTYSEDAPQVLNGIVLKIEYYKDAEEHQTKYLMSQQSGVINENVLTASLKDFIAQNMAEGGHIIVTAFVNSYSNNKDIFILAGDEYTSAEFDVLKSVQKVVKQSGGFMIDSPEENAIYEVVVSTQGVGGDAILSKENDFTYIFPDAWNDGEYSISITAKCVGKVQSCIKQFTLNLQRMPSVSEVKMKREANNTISIYWDAVDNADGYILNMYLYDDSQPDNKGKLVYVFNTKDTTKPNGTSFTTEEIFGDAYTKLIDYDYQNYIDLTKNFNVVFGLVCICKDEQADGTDCKQNSKEFNFNASIKGNGLTALDFVVDDFGVVYFEGDINEDYLYRFMNSSGNEALSEWTRVKGQNKIKFDTSSILGGTSFNIEVITVGSATEQEVTSAQVFSLDSAACTTFGSGTTFNKINNFTRIAQDQKNPQNLKFEFTSVGAITPKIFAGTYENAIFDEKVISFELGQEQTYDLPKILNAIKNAGFNMTGHLYFWMYWQTEESSRLFTRVVSSCMDFDVKLSDESLDFTIVKLKDETGVESIKSDYVNTFAKFTNTDDVGTGVETLGIYVKITQLSGFDEETGAAESMKFVDKTALLENDYFDNKTFALNITELFESEDLAKLSGEFKIEFCKIYTDSGLYSMTQWFEVEKAFTRLASVDSLRLDSGNLIWSGNSSKYQVDFFFGDDITVGDGETFDYSKLRYCQSFIREGALFNASDFANEDTKYFLSVRSIDDNEYNISSRRVFVGREDSPTFVYKNKVNSLIKLEEGKLFFDWPTESDFIALLKSRPSGNGSYSELADRLLNTVFTSPFTFTVSSLANDNVTFKFQFMKENGFSYEVDVKATSLLEEIFSKQISGLDIKNTLRSYQRDVSSTADSALIEKFIQSLENCGGGVGHDKLLFDDLFNKVQEGEYTLRYCLVGNNNMLTSKWYEYGDGTEIYVNAEPNVTIISETNETDRAMTTFKIIIHKSKIYGQEGSVEYAENYKMLLGNHVFVIDEGDKSVKMNGVEESKVTLNYYDMSNGEISQEVTDYLMFYINHNNGDSLLGAFNQEIERTDYLMQIYAVGNNYSISSKSELFRLTFLQIRDLKVRDGEFVWSPERSRSTMVFAQHEDSSQTDEFKVDGEYAEAKFSLEGRRAGNWDIRFVVKGGDIKTNNIYIDSDIYEVSAYKLIAPTMTANLGKIRIENPKDNITALNNTVKNLDSPSKTYEFKIFNDKTGVTNALRRTTAGATYIYEVGTAGLESSHSEYALKNTEKAARIFNAISVGTTVDLVPALQEQSKEKYYIQSLKAESGEVVLSSLSSLMSASMLDSVASLNISDGIVTWDAVNKRTDNDDGDMSANDIVYKVTIAKYTTSSLDSQTSLTVQAVKEYYTQLTRFDFTYLENDSITLSDDPGTLLKITVQALSATVVQGATSGISPDLILVEGGGYVDDKNEKTYLGLEEFVLMSESTSIDEIDRVDSVIDDQTLEVSDGKLRWTYALDLTDLEEGKDEVTEFNERIGFEVVDMQGNLLSSSEDFSVTYDEDLKLFRVVYNDKNLPSGTYSVKIYAISKQAGGKQIKSYPVTKEITKLAEITEDVYSIEVDENGEEWLSFEEYFTSHTDDVVSAFVNDKTYVFTNDVRKYKISATEDSDQVILLESEATVTFKVMQRNKAVIYSDESTIKFSRSTWGAEDKIDWDAVEQKFTWDYTGEGSENEGITYFVEITYGQNTRSYTTKDKYFKPTVIGTVNMFKIRAKVNNSSALSLYLEYNTQVEFNLFESGDGRQQNPYIINNQTQFENIAYRLSKEEALGSYFVTDNGRAEEVSTERIFYFRLGDDIEINSSGIVIKGDFAGNFDGDGKSITFNSSGVSNIKAISVTNSNITVGGTTIAASYTQGCALFENVLSGAYIRNFKLNMSLGGAGLTTSFSQHILVAGVALTNSGYVQEVNVTKFSSNMSGRVTAGIATSAYAGIVAINNLGGEVSSCNLQTSIELNDFSNQQNIFLSGIVYTNNGSIVNCKAGRVADDYAGRDKLMVTVNANASGVQIAGIVITSTATLQNCVNECVISATAASGSEQIAYVAGVCARLRQNGGTYTGNTNNYTEYSDMTGASKQNPNAEGFSESHAESVYITY